MRFTISGEVKLPSLTETAEEAVRTACGSLGRELANELLGHWGVDEEGPYQSRPGKITGDMVAGMDMCLSVVVSFKRSKDSPEAEQESQGDLEQCTACLLWFPKGDLDGLDEAGVLRHVSGRPSKSLTCIFCDSPDSDNSHATKGISKP